LSFVAAATVELRTFDERVGIAITDDRSTAFAAKALGMEAMVTGDHDWARNDLGAFLTALAELPPVVVLAEQKPVFLEVEVRAVHQAVAC
jgi:hypothetical protein